MNERIRELAKQAGFHTELNWDHTDWHSAGHSPLFERFAELIVRTCIAKCDDLNSMKYIAQHFGVEIQGLTDE